MAIPGIVGTIGGGRTNNGSFTVTPPAGAAGYLAVASWGGSSTGLTPPSGWTLVSRGVGPSDNFSCWGIWVGTAAAGSSWTLASASSTLGVALVVGGYDGALTVDVWNRVGGTGSVAIPACPSVSATASGLVVRAAMVQNFSGTVTVGYPAAATDGRVFHTQTPSERWTAAIAHETIGAAGATGTGTYTIGTATTWDPHAATVVINTTSSGTAVTATGTMTLAGTATQSNNYPRTGTGALTLAGSALTVPTLTRSATGTLSLQGSAPSVASQTRTAVGTMTLSGSTSSAQARTATGTLTLAGSATQTNLVSRTATGGLTLAGSAAQTNRYVRTATGGMTLGGTGAVAVSAATRTATGTLTLGGTANASARAVTTAVGQLTLSGTAEGTATMTYTVFIPPGRNAGRMPTDEMPFALLPAEQSVSVIREGGIYREVEEPTAEEVDAAELVYLGGRRHPVTEQEISDLTTAGYGAWIFEFEEVVGL